LLDVLVGQTDAAQTVIESWEKGDLAAAARALDGWVAPARAAIANAKKSAHSHTED
jgi:hypothetical protein